MNGERLDEAGDASRKTNPLAFLRGFLREPQQVGSIAPSSRYLERRIVEAAGLGRARLVVELGPGTGGTTQSFLRELGSEARLLTIEMSPHFHELLNTIDDPRLINHHGSAEDLTSILKQYNLGKADAVISGIPFSALPKEVGQRVVQSVCDSLSDQGCFVAYQFRRDVVDVATPIMGHHTARLEVRNIPPMRVYRWQK